MSLFIIPMAGLSSRFFKAGYSIPKYQLDLHGQSVFRWALSSFEHYFKTDDFLFILRDIYQTKSFVESELSSMGILKYTIIVLNEETSGQAETVYLGLQQTTYMGDLIIFNIDSCRHQYQKPEWYTQASGYLEVFEGEGEHWSFIEPDVSKPARVKRTTEKERISHFCSDGLYSFQTRALFDQAFEFAIRHNQRSKGELYIAPLYNHLISQGLDIRFECVPSSMIEFCGTPDEYQALLSKGNQQ